MSCSLLGPEQISNPPSPPQSIGCSNATNKSAQSSINCIYQAQVAHLACKIIVTWCKNIINHCLSITVENASQENQSTYRIELKPWQFWSKKGLKSIELGNKRIDVFWDFRLAKFSSSSPEPCSDYYIAMVYSEEVALLLGDLKIEAYNRTRSRPSLVEASLLCREETVFGKKCFCTRTTFGNGKKEHNVIIEYSLTEPGDSEMWISIEGIVMIRIMNLHWRFRGNETVLVDNRPVQIFWDVHNWVFRSAAVGHGLFIFKPGKLESASAADVSGSSGDRRKNGNTIGEVSVPGHRPTAMEFCHFLYAWKIE
ncbi:uncharacterized protein LOC131150169 [Malania oleifera]|uniref:uncharacterized protein LOC131150169 n=1 Tax=Malania oleifera TaxID=397392 RepID=UPI0025AE546D|nr:uncharacterized protein LOC131150169 [Malania oleifera]